MFYIFPVFIFVFVVNDFLLVRETDASGVKIPCLSVRFLAISGEILE